MDMDPRLTRCVVEIDGTAFGVLQSDRDGTVFTAAHPRATAYDGRVYPSMRKALRELHGNLPRAA